MNTVIFHVDINSAFLSMEAVYKMKYLGESLDIRRVRQLYGEDSSIIPVRICRNAVAQRWEKSFRHCSIH